MIIGFDLDGVLAEFNPSYAKLITEQTGILFPLNGKSTSEWPPVWYWDRAAGVTKEQEKKLWATIAESDDFWLNLSNYPETREVIHQLENDLYYTPTYFITSRPGDTSKKQTERWLMELGIFKPTVLISSDKGAICKALKVTHYIDDKNENCTDVRDYSPGTKCYMLARPYNSEQQSVPRLDSVMDFIDILKEEVNGTN